jgi:tetratricopeptide (TPR) repeat protein
VGRSRHISPEAYEAYLKGRYFWSRRTPEALQKAVEYFQQAVDKDPSYALAYSGLADSHNMLGDYSYVAPGEAFPRALALAAKALELDDTLAEAHSSLAFAKLFYDQDWAGAEHHFKRAIELNPNYAPAHQWYAINYLLPLKRLDQSFTEVKRAQQLDPLSLIINASVGWQYYQARQYDQAIEQYRKTLELDPNFVTGHLWLGQVYEQKAMFEEALKEFQTAKQFRRAVRTRWRPLGTPTRRPGTRQKRGRFSTN